MQKYVTLVKEKLKSKEMVDTVVVSGGVFLGSIFAYFVQILLGRYLGVENYGIYNSLLSISVVIGVINGSAITSTVKFVTNLRAKKDYPTLSKMYFAISAAAVLIGLVVSLFVVLLHNRIAAFLNIQDSTIIIAFAAFIFPSFLRIPVLSYLQGLLRLKVFSLANIVTNVFRLLAVLVAMYLGYKVGGVFICIGAGVVLGYVLFTSVIKRDFVKFSKEGVRKHFKKIIAFASSVIIVQTSLIMLNNVDVILVKHYFDGFTAGLYSGLVTVGKVFLFAATTVSVAMFPQISAAHSEGQDYIKKFRFFLTLQLSLILIGTLIFWTVPGQIVQIMFGETYLPVVTYLPKFIIFFGLYTMVYFMSYFLLAVELTSVFKVQIPAILLQILLISVFHGSLDQVINMNIITGIILLTGMSVFAKKNLK